MIDVTGILVRALADDAEITDFVGDRVFGFRIPKDAEPPLIVVMTNSQYPADAPAAEWWSSVTSVDVHTVDPALSAEIADVVRRVVPKVVGAREEGVVADSQVESVLSIVDDGWTPTRFRQIVTVDVTAREP